MENGCLSNWNLYGMGFAHCFFAGRRIDWARQIIVSIGQGYFGVHCRKVANASVAMVSSVTLPKWSYVFPVILR